MAFEHAEPHHLALSECEAQWADLDDRQITKRQLIELSEEISYIVRKQRERQAAHPEGDDPQEDVPAS